MRDGHRVADLPLERAAGARYVPLFWRLFIPNATVLTVASIVLMVRPANGRVPILATGLAVMVGVNVVLMRRAFAPLIRLTTLMERVDPLLPGERIPPPSSQSEVTVLTRSFNAMLDRLEAERRESGRRALSEREAERRRLAAELHDELGQDLTAILLQVDRLAEASGPEAAAPLGAIRDDVLGTIEDVRRLARELRPEALDSLGLVPALTNLTERLAAHAGIEIVRRLQRDLPPLGDEEDLVLFRVAQESLTNVIRHARASRVDVVLARVDGHVELLVRDDGCGLGESTESDGGIRTMRERAVSIGGRLEIRSGDGDPGTEVRLRLAIPTT